MTTLNEPQQVPLPQPVLAPLTRAAIFLVVTVKPEAESYATVRSFCGDLSGLIRAVEFRDIDAGLTCIAAFGSAAWDKLFGQSPASRIASVSGVPGRQPRGPRHSGDVLFHIRAQRMDICFELATQIMDRIGDAVSVADEVQGFRYFEDRDLIGFVDGTENPRGTVALEAALVGEEDAPFAGGSYVMVQKYLHDMKAWNALSTEEQERVIGRRKLSNIELEDGVKPSSAHSALTVIEENGKEVKILRDNMPFGQPGRGDFGTYFIGYCRTPRITEQMLENMVVGRPRGNYDRLLDFSRPVTGGLFFAPAATFLDDAIAPEPLPEPIAVPPTAPDPPAARAVADGSLGVGSPTGERNE